MRAQVHIEDGTSHRRCSCQSDRICSRFHRPKNICPGVFEQPHHIKSENDIILSNQNTAAKQRLRFSFRHFWQNFHASTGLVGTNSLCLEA